jgi:hypothetical protein
MLKPQRPSENEFLAPKIDRLASLSRKRGTIRDKKLSE